MYIATVMMIELQVMTSSLAHDARDLMIVTGAIVVFCSLVFWMKVTCAYQLHGSACGFSGVLRCFVQHLHNQFVFKETGIWH